MSTSGERGTRFAVRGTARLAYDRIESSRANATTAVVLLHDLLADRGAWREVRERTGGADSIAIDARGHGASATLTNHRYTLADLAADVLAVMDAESIPRAVIGGHGLGGTTALEIARSAPARVTALLLIEPAIDGMLERGADLAARRLLEARRASDREAAELAYKGVFESALDRFLRPRWGAGWRDVASKPRQGAIRRHAAALAGVLPALAVTPAALERWTSIAAAVRLLNGEDAGEIERLVAERLAALLPVASIGTVPLGPRPDRPLAGPAAAPIAAELAALLAPGDSPVVAVP